MSAQLDRWNEVRTAFLVARHGTLSAAAEELGIHHTTAQRQIAALEAKLGTRLFYRNPRGYAPTEAGRALLQVAAATQDQFDQLAARIVGLDRRLSGRLVVTTVPEFGTVLVPLLAAYQRDNPDLAIDLIAEPRLLKLEYGEAHVSIRAGRPPEEPDNVVQPLTRVAATLWASTDYVARNGRLTRLDAIAGHRFVAGPRNEGRNPLSAWVERHVPEDAIAFRASDAGAMMAAIENGIGIGPAPCWTVASGSGALIPMFAPPADWHGHLWLVTHVDLHRTAKVQSFLTFMKQAIAERREAIDGSSLRRQFDENGEWRGG